MADEHFNVVQFFPNGQYEYLLRFVDAQRAVEKAKEVTLRPAALIGAIARIIITDGGDNTVFEWTFGKGVTFPQRGPDGRFVSGC